MNQLHALTLASATLLLGCATLPPVAPSRGNHPGFDLGRYPGAEALASIGFAPSPAQATPVQSAAAINTQVQNG